MLFFLKYSSRLSTSNHKFLLNSIHFISFECYFDILFNPLPMWRVTWWNKNESWGWCLMMISYFNAFHHISMYILTKLSDFFGAHSLGWEICRVCRGSLDKCVFWSVSTWPSALGRACGKLGTFHRLLTWKVILLSPEWSFCPMIRLMVGVMGTPQIYHKKSASHQGSKHYSPITMEQWGRFCTQELIGGDFLNPSYYRPQKATRNKQLLPFLKPMWKIIVFFEGAVLMK